MQGIRRVVCGMSGGVDSAVAALILKKKGYEVVGLFMRNWDSADESGRCTINEELEDAAYVCRKLSIPLQEVNFVKEYWTQVFSQMLQDYQQGFTPNPDILCNRHIKFDSFLHHAQERLGAEVIATGHYARTSAMTDQDVFDKQTGIKLLKAADTVKDQTFFLSQIHQQALKHTLFPLGNLTKNVVKHIAMEAGLEKIARKKESMGICFIGSRQFPKFIEQYTEPNPGHFIDIETQQVVGHHKGIHYWTLGQRALIGGMKAPYFIVDKDPDSQNILVALGTDHPALFCQSFVTKPMHWIHEPPVQLLQNHVIDADFRFQHRHPLLPCMITLSNDRCLHVSLPQPMRAITPGQYAVFYLGQECLGSAKINQTGPSLYALDGCVRRVANPKQFS